MSDRDTGFLYEDERKLIDAYTPSKATVTVNYEIDGKGQIDKENLPSASPTEDDENDDGNERKVKYRLKNGVAGRQGLREQLRGIEEDLRRIYWFHSELLDQPAGEWGFEDHTLPRVEDDIDNLLQLLGGWKQKAQNEVGEGIRKQLSEQLSIFHEDLTEKQRIYDGETDIDQPKKERELDELEARRTALVALLKDEELREMLRFIANHENEKRKDVYKEREKGKNNWAWWISHQLAGKHGVVTRGVWSDHCYALTHRGELVHRVLNGLEDTPAIEAGSERNGNWARYALLLLRTHHPGYEELAAI